MSADTRWIYAQPNPAVMAAIAKVELEAALHPKPKYEPFSRKEYR